MKKTKRRGFTLTEMLCTLLILSLVMTSAVTGMTALSSAYRRMMEKSQAEELGATLSAVLTHELSYAKYVKTETGGTVTEFYSDTYRSCKYVILTQSSGTGTAWNSGAAGRLAIQTIASAPTAAYTPLANQTVYAVVADDAYAPDLTASVTAFTYDAGTGLFSLTLKISSKAQDGLVTMPLTIKNLNAAFR